MRLTLLSCVLLIGCGDMSPPLSTVDDLRILDLQVAPVTPAAGEFIDIEPIVLDSVGDGFDTWTWWCSLDDVCGTGELPVMDPPLFQVWGMACATGTCDGPPQLEDPETWLVDFPIETVSVGSRRIGQSPSPFVRLNENPVWVGPTMLPDVVAGEELTIEVEVTDETSDRPTVWGFGTAGGWQEENRVMVDGRATLVFVAPEEPGSVELVLIADDGLGGGANARFEIQVLAP